MFVVLLHDPLSLEIQLWDFLFEFSCIIQNSILHQWWQAVLARCIKTGLNNDANITLFHS